MRILFLPLALLITVSLFESCEQAFDPRAPFREQMLVYAVLTMDRDVQYVRVATTYNPNEIGNPEGASEKPVTGATVELSTDGLGALLRDTLLTRPDTSRYRTPIHAYVTSLVPIEHGRTYSLVINSPSYGVATSRITIPTQALVRLIQDWILDDPANYDDNEELRVLATLSNLARGHLVRMYVVYEVLDSGGWTEAIQQVPTQFSDRSFNLKNAVYPELARTLSSGLSVVYQYGAYRSVLLDVYLRTSPRSLRFKAVIVVVLQAEDHLYAYWSTANGFRDELSVRMDEPFVSNITGGLGLFGGYALDSLVHKLPDYFSMNRP